MTYLIQGLLLGISISILIGPMVLLFIKASMTKGFKGGLTIAFGAWISDLLYILASFYGMTYLSRLINESLFERITGILGGSLLLILGIALLLDTKSSVNIEEQKSTQLLDSYPALFLKGFLINMLNPFCAVVWFGAISTIVLSDDTDSFDVILFVMGSLGTIVISDIFKVYFSNQLVQVLSHENQIKLKRIAGIGFLIFGLVLMIRVFC